MGGSHEQFANVGLQPGSPPSLYKRVLTSPVAEVHVHFKHPAKGNWTLKPLSGSAGQRRGLRYERRVCEILDSRFERFTNNQVIRFRYEGSLQWHLAEPDGWLYFQGNSRIVLVECKTYHAADACNQLQLYKTLLTKWDPSLRISCLEICESYTPGIALPLKENLVQNYREFPMLPDDEHNVFILSTRQLRGAGDGLYMGNGVT